MIHGTNETQESIHFSHPGASIMKSGLSGDAPLDQLKEITTLQTQFEVFRQFKKTVERYGYRCFLVLRLPPPTSLDLAENSIITNFPAEFLGAFDRQKLMRSSPLFARLRTSILPFSFRYAEFVAGRSAKDATMAAKLYEEFGLVDGICLPVQSVEGDRCAVVFAGERDPLDNDAIAQLMLLTLHLFQRLGEVSQRSAKLEQPLTERELECLTWTAAGKTSADIAQILELSEHTVNHYLNRATKKLDTVNRTQAVAKALRRSLIR